MTERYNALEVWSGETIEGYVNRCLNLLRNCKVSEYNDIVCCLFNDVSFYLNLYDTVETGIRKYYTAAKERNKLCSLVSRTEFRNTENVKILEVQKIIRLICSFDTLILDTKNMQQMRKVLNWIKNYSPYLSRFSKDLDSNMYVYKILSSYNFVEGHITLTAENKKDIYIYYEYIVERFMESLRLNQEDKGLIDLIDDWKRIFAKK